MVGVLLIKPPHPLLTTMSGTTKNRQNITKAKEKRRGFRWSLRRVGKKVSAEQKVLRLSARQKCHPNAPFHQSRLKLLRLRDTKIKPRIKIGSLKEVHKSTFLSRTQFKLIPTIQIPSTPTKTSDLKWKNPTKFKRINPRQDQHPCSKKTTTKTKIYNLRKESLPQKWTFTWHQPSS